MNKFEEKKRTKKSKKCIELTKTQLGVPSSEWYTAWRFFTLNFERLNTHCAPHVIYILWIFEYDSRLIFDGIFEGTKKIYSHSTFHILLLTDIFKQCEQDFYPVFHTHIGRCFNITELNVLLSNNNSIV